MRPSHKFYRINYQIAAPKFRLLDETGKQIGVIERFEALKKAQAEGKDLVEIAPGANPPVVKLINYKKFKYLEEKKQREQRKNKKNVGVKEIRLSPFMGEHDFQVKIRQAESFLKEGNQLKISVPFRGREITHKEFGREQIDKAINLLGEKGKLVKLPYMEGRVMVAMLAAQNKTVKKQENEQKEN